MINPTSIYNTKYLTSKSTSFKGFDYDIKTPTVDKFVADINKQAEQEKKGGLAARYFWSSIALLVGGAVTIGYEMVMLYKIKKAEKLGEQIKKQKLQNSVHKNIKWAILSGLAVMQGVQYLFDKQSDKNFEQFKKDFNKLNKYTSAELDNNMLRSFYIGGYYNFNSGKIRINKNLLNDPYCKKFLLNKIVKHELTHAMQAELIASSKDGIKKLNYANMYQMAQTIKSDENIKNEFLQINKELENDNGKYDNFKIDLYGANINLKNFVKAICIFINNDNVTYNDIPIFIDCEHYQKVIDKKGKLTDEEEKLAAKYYLEALNYPVNINIFNAYNPFSRYRQNSLEKEARKNSKKL